MNAQGVLGDGAVVGKNDFVINSSDVAVVVLDFPIDLGEVIQGGSAGMSGSPGVEKSTFLQLQSNLNNDRSSLMCQFAFSSHS